MKKTLLFFLMALLVLIVACSNNTGSAIEGDEEQISSRALVSVISSLPNVKETLTYSEETDPNELLGKPNNYIGKIDFEDDRCEQLVENHLEGGTIEYFSNEEDCDARYEYLEKLNNAKMGAFGLNQYMYKYPTLILRVSYDLTPTEAEQYKNELNEYLGQEPLQNY